MEKIHPFRIPEAIWLNAMRIAVNYKEDLVHKEDVLGLSVYREMEIRLQHHTSSVSRTPEQIEQTYFHEVIHWILFMMGENDLSKNEKFVDIFAHLLHQALTMAEYSEPHETTGTGTR